MSRKLLMICCIAFAHAGILRTDNPAPAISYSSIRFGVSGVEKNPEPFGYGIATAPYDNLVTTDDRYLTFKTVGEQKAGIANLNIKKFEANSNELPTTISGPVPLYSLPPRVATRPLASRNIPVEPSPDFDSVPSVIKTEGLSAYASFPLETLAPKAPISAEKTEESVSILKSIESSPKNPVELSYSLRGVDGLSTLGGWSLSPEASAAFSREFEALAATSGPSQVTYTEAPVNHVSVSSSGVNYSW